MHSTFECDVSWFCFCFDFVRLHAWCSCCFIVSWRWDRLNLDVRGQGGGKGLKVDGQGSGRSWKLDDSHGCYMCIVPW